MARASEPALPYFPVLAYRDAEARLLMAEELWRSWSRWWSPARCRSTGELTSYAPTDRAGYKPTTPVVLPYHHLVHFLPSGRACAPAP